MENYDEMQFVIIDLQIECSSILCFCVNARSYYVDFLSHLTSC